MIYLTDNYKWYIFTFSIINRLYHFELEKKNKKLYHYIATLTLYANMVLGLISTKLKKYKLTK